MISIILLQISAYMHAYIYILLKKVRLIKAGKMANTIDLVTIYLYTLTSHEVKGYVPFDL